MQNGPYYDSPILNEIHTHFPALLYNTGQFQNLNSVFRYVREQMRNRYDVFSTEQQRFNQQFNNGRQTRQTGQTRQFRQWQAEPHTPPVRQAGNFIDILNTSDFNRLLSFVMGANAQTNFMDPVLVVATQAQIQQGSILHTTLADGEAPCPICQDVIRAGEIIRRLNYCNHCFHRNCIDTWYQRNVHCPVCRRDIRSTV